MIHNIRIYGFSYKLRPVEFSDARFIIDTRLEDSKKSQFIHKISDNLNLQIHWMEQYFKRENDYYFIIENLFTGEKEGLISIYNIRDNKAEWGRWVIKNSSLAAVESVNLIYRVAFEKLNLDELYTRTIEDNTNVVNFHKSINAKFRALLKCEFKLGNKKYNAVEQFVDKEYYFSFVKEKLDKQCRCLFERNMRNFVGYFKYHHYGVACKKIELSLSEYSNYFKEDSFEDVLQGVRGLFIKYDKIILELLENLPNSHTLDFYINNNIKFYHTAYIVSNIEKIYKFLIEKLKAKVISDMKVSSYFKKRICFFILKNNEMIELIENK